jgi:hypothetical protein
MQRRHFLALAPFILAGCEDNDKPAKKPKPTKRQKLMYGNDGRLTPDITLERSFYVSLAALAIAYLMDRGRDHHVGDHVHARRV